MPTFSNFSDALLFCAQLIAEGARQRASWSTGASRGGSIPSAIRTSGVRQNTNGEYEVDVLVDTKIAPQAGAFEFGSGIHSVTNPRKYEIRPKNFQHLKFFWIPNQVPYGSPKFAGVILSGGKGSTEGTYYFNYVEHPGVKARPYLRPSRDANVQTIRQILGQTFRTMLVSRFVNEATNHP